MRRKLLKAGDIDRLIKARRQVQYVRLTHDDRLTLIETLRFMHVEEAIGELLDQAMAIPRRDAPPEDCPLNVP